MYAYYATGGSQVGVRCVLYHFDNSIHWEKGGSKGEVRWETGGSQVETRWEHGGSQVGAMWR